jgi:acetoin utilization protein AcuC
MTQAGGVCVFTGEALGEYAFGDSHPFGPRRLPAFLDEFRRRGLDRMVQMEASREATQEEIERFHHHDYVEWVKRCSRRGHGFLDGGDTPVFPGIYEAAATVAGSAICACEKIMNGECQRAFLPIGGLHHAGRDHAAGFCVFNDCGVVIESLMRVYALERIVYVDIDAHHGDGVFYAFEGVSRVVIADIHEDGRFLYPGTGFADETGTGEAKGTKLNIPLPPGAGDADFFSAWEEAEAFVERFSPEFIVFQCGADCLAGDPITHLQYSPACHRHAAERLCLLADRHCRGRILGLGGGGYALNNLAVAWCEVVETFCTIHEISL